MSASPDEGHQGAGAERDLPDDTDGNADQPDGQSRQSAVRNPDIRKAMSLALDRKPYNTILMEGLALTGGAMLPKPVGEWGMPPDMVAAAPGL